MKPLKIRVSDRIDLYISNQGFKFWNRLTPPNEENFEKWEKWASSWQPYQPDNIKQKIYATLDNLPERFKCETFYQSISF